MRTVLERFREHWLGFSIGLFTGVLIAMPLGAPVFGAVIPDGAGNMWGAALGAAIAVLGALHVERRRGTRDQLKAASVILEIASTTFGMCQQLRLVISKPTCEESLPSGEVIFYFREKKAEDLKLVIRALINQTEICIEKLGRFHGLLMHLPPTGVMAALSIENNCISMNRKLRSFWTSHIGDSELLVVTSIFMAQSQTVEFEGLCIAVMKHMATLEGIAG